MVDLANNHTNASIGKRLALVIGVNEAPNSNLPPLNYASKDAEAIAEVLQQHCGFELLEPPLLGEQATSERVKTAILDLAEDRTNEDFLFLYFSGHGLPMKIEADRDDVYLITHNFRERDVRRDENFHLSMRWLRDRLYIPTEAGRVLLILDCCYAGEMGRTSPDPYLEDLKKRINYYFGAPGSDSGARSGGLRLALTATGHNALANERDGHGLMTNLLLQALRGEVDAVLETENRGQISIQRLHRYLEITMQEQKPGLSGDSAGRDCILTSYPDRAAQLRAKPSRPSSADRPNNYIPFPRNLLFQPRPGEFERLEHLLFSPEAQQKPARLGLIGVVGMGGVGKTQLAVELAYRYQKRFPAGVFWTPATGTTVFDWQRQFAELAFNTGYLPPDDDVSSPENESCRARHFCRYLAQHADALLILDNVEDPNLVMTALPSLAGGEVACPVLYTSRITQRPLGATTHPVEQLPEEGALRLLLESTRPALLSEILAGSSDAEAKAARFVCQSVGYLPLALVHLRGLLARDQKVTLVRLAEVLKQRGALDVAKTHQGGAAPLFATFELSWKKVQNEGARRLFKLASYFPEATPIPIWLLGLAAGLGESGDIFEPLGEALLQLQELSLIEELSGDQIRLHPLIREFGRRLVTEDGDKGKALLEEAGERLVSEFTDLNSLERRARREGYWSCLEQVRATYEYARLLGTDKTEQLGRIERWLDRESYLLGNEQLWPQKLPGLFYQQLFNRSVEEGYPLIDKDAPARWLRQENLVGAEDRSLLRVFAGHIGWVTSVAFSPDGTKVLTGSHDGMARLWEAASGKVLATLGDHTSPVNSVAFSPNGTKVLTGSDDRTARLWEAARGKLVKLLEGHRGPVNSVAFSPDGTKVLTGSDDRTARLWEAASGKVLTILEDRIGSVNSVVFSPDGTKALAGSANGTARLWEVASGKVLTILGGYIHRVECMAFSPDGTKVLTGSIDVGIRLWEAASGKLVKPLGGQAISVTSVAFSPDGTKVLAGLVDGIAQLWEVASGKVLATLEGHTDLVRCVAFSPDGTQVLTGSDDGTARLWKTASGKVLTTLEDHIGPVRCVAFSPDGTKVLAGLVDGIAQLWEVASGKLLKTLRGHTDLVRCVAFSPDGTKMLTGSDDRTIRLWETASGKLLRTLEGHSYWENNVAFSSDGTQVLTGSGDRTIKLWEVGSGKLLKPLEGQLISMTSIAFSPDGTQVLTGSDDGIIKLWEVGSGKLLKTLYDHTSRVDTVAFLPDGTRVLAGSADGVVLVWETASGKMLSTLEGHTRSVNSITFSLDGAQVLTWSSLDRTVRLWEVASGKMLAILEDHIGLVRCVAFSPDGSLVVTCDQHGRVFLWQTSKPKIGHLLGIYIATYEIEAIHWQDATHVILADKGGPQFRPHFYRLKLEGRW